MIAAKKFMEVICFGMDFKNQYIIHTLKSSLQ